MLNNRAYTNVILTVIAVLLVLMLLSPPDILIPSAQARDEQQRAKQLAVNVRESTETANAVREVAKANQSIAAAIQTLAESVDRAAGVIAEAAAK